MLCFLAHESNLQIKCGRSLFLSPENLSWKPLGGLVVSDAVAVAVALASVAVVVADAVSVAVDTDDAEGRLTQSPLNRNWGCCSLPMCFCCWCSC